MQINHDFLIQSGISKSQIRQLINFSHTDPEIQKFTSDKIRFADKSAFDQWFAKDRIVYTLTDKKKNLLGIIWFGQKDPPSEDIKANFTFAIRLYGSARGQGLSGKFMKLTFDDLLQKQLNPKITGFWLETAADNLAAIHTYKKFGFKSVSILDGKNIMIFSPKKRNI